MPWDFRLTEDTGELSGEQQDPSTEINTSVTKITHQVCTPGLRHDTQPCMSIGGEVTHEDRHKSITVDKTWSSLPLPRLDGGG